MENFLSLCIDSRHGRTALPGKIARPRASSLTSLFDNVIFLAELPYLLRWHYQGRIWPINRSAQQGRETRAQQSDSAAPRQPPRRNWKGISTMSTSHHPERIPLAADPYRPAYHYLPPCKWMNDPNGTIYWKGRYHLFYQHNPDGPWHGNIHWGHASSEDLVHWTDHPISLTPGPEGPDRQQCYSGAAFVNAAGIPTHIYHGVPDGICLATSTDDLLIHWDKHPANPIIPDPGPGGEFVVTGAPCGWVEEGVHYAVTGNSINSPDAAYLFRSTDMSHWEYMHPFYSGGQFTEPGEDCGCPDFFLLDGKPVLSFTSHARGAQFYVGSYVDHRFKPERHKRLAFAETSRPGVYCEGLTLLDQRNRRILFGRISEARFGYAQVASGWSGICALPLLLSLGEDQDLLFDPVPELEMLRTGHTALRDLQLQADAEVPLAISGDSLEIRATLEWDDAEEIGLKVRCSPDAREETLVRFNTNPGTRHAPAAQVGPRRELILDVSRSSTSSEVSNRAAQRAAFKVPYGSSVDLRIFVDRSVVEVIANRRHYVAKRIYPARRDSLGVRAYARGGSATLRSFDAWHMEAIWP